MSPNTITTILDLVGVASLAVFAALVWRPAAALAVVGVAALAASYAATRTARPPAAVEITDPVTGTVRRAS